MYSSREGIKRGKPRPRLSHRSPPRNVCVISSFALSARCMLFSSKEEFLFWSCALLGQEILNLLNKKRTNKPGPVL